MDKRLKKHLIYLVVLSVISSYGCRKKENVRVNDIDYISYDKTIEVVLGNKDIMIYDESNYSNPNIKVVDSYQVSDIESIRSICDVIMEYNEVNGTKWNRTYDSIVNEWLVHNLIYNMGICKERTGSVDFTNSEEIIYKLIKLY